MILVSMIMSMILVCVCVSMNAHMLPIEQPQDQWFFLGWYTGQSERNVYCYVGICWGLQHPKTNGNPTTCRNKIDFNFTLTSCWISKAHGHSLDVISNCTQRSSPSPPSCWCHEQVIAIDKHSRQPWYTCPDPTWIPKPPKFPEIQDSHDSKRFRNAQIA